MSRTSWARGCARQVCVALVLLVQLALAASAHAVTFGADLSQPVLNGTPTCGSLGYGSCLGYNIIPSSYAPASGTVSAARVKVGPFTGPMQVVVLRSYYYNNQNNPGTPSQLCCFLQEYGPTFTPSPNAITTVPTSLAMVDELAPPPGDYKSVSKDDFLALSILNSTTPVPLGQGSGGLAFYYAPAPNPATEPAPSSNGIPGSYGAGIPSYYIMLNADLMPISSGGGGGATAPLGFPGDKGHITANHKSAQIPLVCQLTTACQGTLTLQNLANAATAAKKKHKAKVLGSAPISIPSGQSATITLKLNKAGRCFVRGHKRVVLYAIANVDGTKLTVKLTLTKTK